MAIWGMPPENAGLQMLWYHLRPFWVKEMHQGRGWRTSTCIKIYLSWPLHHTALWIWLSNHLLISLATILADEAYETNRLLNEWKKFLGGRLRTDSITLFTTISQVQHVACHLLTHTLCVWRSSMSMSVCWVVMSCKREIKWSSWNWTNQMGSNTALHKEHYVQLVVWL